MKTVIVIILMTVSYFIGNISPATLLARAKGKDIKKEGSGNAGTTNVLRVLGAKAAVITLIIDVAKGFIATIIGFYIAYSISKSIFDPIFTPPEIYANTAMAWCGLAVFIGHIWPIMFRFKGGKGVATALGVILAIDYRVALICLGIFAIIVIASRMVSLGSICAAAAFPVVYVIMLVFNVEHLLTNVSMYQILPRVLPLIIMVIILITKHRDNIERIIKGEERKLIFKPEEPPVK